jgi:signal transduction histidine kinase
MTELSSLDTAGMIELGRQLRRGALHASSTAQVANILVDVLSTLEPPWTGLYVFVRRGDEDQLLASRGAEASPSTDRILSITAPVWPGETVVVEARSSSVLDPDLARRFDTLALYIQWTWIEAPESRRSLADRYETTRANVLEALLAAQEKAALEVRLRADAELAAHNTLLRRSQRAMLNVIDDLREAREALTTRVEERTRELESRNRDLEDFVYIASHDLQEPLRTVAGYLQMIERRYGDKLGSEGDEFIRFSIEGAQRMQALIESLLVYSRVSTKENVFEPFPLDHALDAALQNLAFRIDETHAVIERSTLPTACADRVQMAQLFQNLLSNGLKFAGEKPPRIHVSGSVGSGVCTLTLRDEGIGFNPKYVDRIFKMFRRLRRDTPGTGIGLAVCKKIVERHGGHIEAQSTPGEGATFTIQFPAGVG